MITELEIKVQLAEIILRLVNDPKHPGRKARICKEYHFAPRMLKAENLFNMKSSNLFRLLLALAQEETERVFIKAIMDFAAYIISVADMEDGTPEALIAQHAGGRFTKS